MLFTLILLLSKLIQLRIIYIYDKDIAIQSFIVLSIIELLIILVQIRSWHLFSIHYLSAMNELTKQNLIDYVVEILIDKMKCKVDGLNVFTEKGHKLAIKLSNYMKAIFYLSDDPDVAVFQSQEGIVIKDENISLLLKPNLKVKILYLSWQNHYIQIY